MSDQGTAVVASADELIALGEAERAAFRKFRAADLALDRAEETHRVTHPRSPERWSECGMIAALGEARDDAEHAWLAGIQRVIDTPATTIAGLLAKLKLLAWGLHDGGGSFGGSKCGRDLLSSVVTNAEQLAGGV